MALTYSISQKSNIQGQNEILIRYKSGKFAARAKSGIFILSEWYDFVISNAFESIYKGKRIITDEMKQIQAYHEGQKINLSKINSIISETLKNTDLDRSTSEWLCDCIDKFYQRGKFIPKVETVKITTLLQFVGKFMAEMPNRKDKTTGRQLTVNSMKQYPTTVTYLKDFARLLRKKDFEFAEIDQSFYDKFVDFLQKKSFTQNSVGKHVKVLKIFMNEATRQGYNNITHYNDFHVFMEDVDNVYLNELELQQLKDADFSNNPCFDRVRDWFLLLAWTGSRFSDLEKVVKADIKEGLISFRQQKTNTKVVIPVHPVVMEIFEKYNFNLPNVISNQRFNEYVKGVCKTVGITSTETMTHTIGGKVITETFEKWEHVTSHTGRRCFATNMYKGGLPTLAIMSITGHKTEKSFLKYIKVKQEEHAEMMKKAWEKMYK
jgi:integrase